MLDLKKYIYNQMLLFTKYFLNLFIQFINFIQFRSPKKFLICKIHLFCAMKVRKTVV